MKTYKIAILVLTLILIGMGTAVSPSNDVKSANTKALLQHLSESVITNYWAAHSEAASPRFSAALATIKQKKGSNSEARKFCESRSGNDVFNCDVFGLPQNEESITASTANTDLVLGGTNDFRGLVDPESSTTGWHLSIDGGKSIKNEGLLPSVTLSSGVNVPSGGDPVDFLFADSTGSHAFAASLAYNPIDPFANPNGIAVYRSEPATLSSCPGGSDPSCWPTRRLVAESDAGHFLDKEWLFVGVQGGIPYVWVTYSDFNLVPPDPTHPFEAEIKAVRCSIDLTTCTAPINISVDPVDGRDVDVQFSDVTVGPDGRAYITWSKIVGEIDSGPEQTFIHKIRVETEPGSATFGPEMVIYSEDRAIPFGGHLQANDFRIATYLKSDVAWVAGHPRIFAIWDACSARPLAFVCEFPEIKLSYSDNGGANWNGPYVISTGGVNYFPTISVDRADPSNNKASIAWYTHSFDPAFWNKQDVLQGSIDTGKNSYGPAAMTRITSSSNEVEADPLLGGFFIGDYFEVAQVKGKTYTHYNANYRQIPLLGPFGPPFSDSPSVNQQDNFLSVR